MPGSRVICRVTLAGVVLVCALSSLRAIASRPVRIFAMFFSRRSLLSLAAALECADKIRTSKGVLLAGSAS